MYISCICFSVLFLVRVALLVGECWEGGMKELKDEFGPIYTNKRFFFGCCCNCLCYLFYVFFSISLCLFLFLFVLLS